jgi:aldehyde dehydrogenase (NAD+)
MAIREYQLLINGEHVDASGGRTFPTTNPSDGSVIGNVADASREDATRAVEAARAAFDAGGWSEMPARERSQRLLRLWEILQGRQGELAEIETLDAGHTARMANLFTIPLAIEHLRITAEIAAQLGEYDPLPPAEYPVPSWEMVRNEPYGVCTAITPFNLPLLLGMWKIAPALAAGNTLVVKPSPFTPLSTLEFGRILTESDLFPPGVFNVITGHGPEPSEELVVNPLVDKVAFTGSTAIGRRIMQLASSTIKKVTLELGGKSPNIILDDADLDIAVPGALWAQYIHEGQFCEAGSRCFVPASMYDEVVSRLVELAESIRFGPADSYESDAGPLINQGHFMNVQRHVDSALDEGAKLLTGGERLMIDGYDDGYYYKPTIFGDVDNSMRIAQEEVFGPVLSVMKYESVEDAIRMANDTIYGLAGGVWSRNTGRALGVAKRLKTGIVWINDYHLVSGYGPFGGYKQSGIGREIGDYGLREYVQKKYIHVSQAPTKDEKFWFQVLGL